MGFKRKKAPRRSKRGKRSYKKRSRPRPSRPRDPTVYRLISGKDKVTTIVRSTYPIIGTLAPPAFTLSTTYGMQIQFGSSGIPSTGMNFTFDPSGTYGTGGGIWNSLAVPVAKSYLADWTAYASLYTHYKVTKMTFKFRYYDEGSGDSNTPDIWVKYNNEFLANNPTPATLAVEKGWINKKFTTDSPHFQYSIYPKVNYLLDAGDTTLSTDARATKKMPWTNVNTPADIYGLSMFVYYPGVAGNSYGVVNMDTIYTIKFKKSQ